MALLLRPARVEDGFKTNVRHNATAIHAMPHDNRNRARTLPDEILVRIFDFFTAHVGLEKRLHQGSEADATPDYHTLSCVTKVSRHFHRLARPVLYRLVVLHESTTCALLFRTLLERPKVGHLVKGLSLHVYDDHFDSETDGVLQHHLEVLYGKDHRGRAVLPLPQSAHAQLAVLLACVPQLEALDVMLDDKDGRSSDFLTIFPYWKAVLSCYLDPHERLPVGKDDCSANAFRSHFSALRQVRLRHWRLLNKTPRLPYATQLLNLPTLESMHCDWTNLSLEADQILHMKLDSTALSLKDIYLENSSIDIKSLECILSRCTSIRSLIVSWGEEQASDVKLNYREIGTVLRNHCITLETLVLNPVKSRPVHEAGEDGNSIGPLGKLCQLKRLAIDSNALLGHSQYLGGSDERKQKLQDLLPVSLEVLHLSFPIGAVKTGEKALYQLLDCAGATVPQLRQVSVDDRNVRFRKDFETLGWTRTGLKEVHNEMPYHSGCFYPILTRSARAQLEPAHTTDGMV